MKILLTLLAFAVCAEAVPNLDSLLGFAQPASRASRPYLPPPPPPSHHPAPANPGYASYYQHPSEPVHSAPAFPAPVQQPQVIRVIQPVYYIPRPSPPAPTPQHYRMPPPAYSNSQSIPKTGYSVAPTQPYTHSGSSIPSSYSVEMSKSEGHWYSLPPERITIEKTISPISTIETSEAVFEPRAPTVSVAQPTSVEITPQTLNNPIIVSESPAYEPAAPTTTTAAPPTVDHTAITEQIVNQVSPHIIQQAIPLVVDRAVPQVVYQAQQAAPQQQQQYIHTDQGEPVQIVTPLNLHQQPKQDDKVYIMYATSIPQGESYDQFQNNFDIRGQYDDAENLVIPTGNQQQQSQAQAHSSQSAGEIIFEKAIDTGDNVEEDRRDSAGVSEQIIRNFQLENLAHQQEFGSVGDFSGGGAFSSSSAGASASSRGDPRNGASSSSFSSSSSGAGGSSSSSSRAGASSISFNAGGRSSGFNAGSISRASSSSSANAESR
ncbi:uncharacterized protein LOC131689197 [Topomyia yanbarensis]|uniref:uncharacterized protein LOC131689197 n=1 Tax=Topomyia yanbarensis TaxID=2498891 RepID=UPI00273AF6F2|nr:uncharacterized protein LOC131689197 [Topomyia yanbarensis]